MTPQAGPRFTLLQSFLGLAAGTIMTLDPAIFQPLGPPEPQPGKLIANAELIANPDGTLTLTDERCDVPTLQIYRNGVRQKAGVDFRVAAASSGGVIVWPAWTFDATDTLLADYQRL